MVQDLDSPTYSQTELIKNDEVFKDSDAIGRDVLASSVKDEIRTSTVSGNNSSTRTYAALSVSPVLEKIPENPSPSSCSEDWRLSSGGKSGSGDQARSFKRLRKYGDIHRNPLKKKEETGDALVELARSSECSSPITHKRARGKSCLSFV